MSMQNYIRVTGKPSLQRLATLRQSQCAARLASLSSDERRYLHK